jgi:hypothetical protein
MPDSFRAAISRSHTTIWFQLGRLRDATSGGTRRSAASRRDGFLRLPTFLLATRLMKRDIIWRDCSHTRYAACGLPHAGTSPRKLSAPLRHNPPLSHECSCSHQSTAIVVDSRARRPRTVSTRARLVGLALVEHLIQQRSHFLFLALLAGAAGHDRFAMGTDFPGIMLTPR